MKKILLFLVFFPYLINCQDRLWGVETEIDSVDFNRLIATIDTPGYALQNPADIDRYIKGFHPVHLNNDNLIDFIYYGFVGAESNGIVIYINNNGQLNSVEYQLGKIREITRKFPDSPAIIDFIQYGCCDDPINFWQQWTINSNSSIEKTDEYYFMDGTEIPEDFNYFTRFEIVNSPYKLRATPEIINYEPINYHFEKGNLIAEYISGDTGFALASKTDNTGRVWWFVALDKPNQSGYSVYSINRNEKWLGWMSSRYVKIINK